MYHDRNAAPTRIAALASGPSDTSESEIAVANYANTVAVTASLIASLAFVALGFPLQLSDTAITRAARSRSRCCPLFFFCLSGIPAVRGCLMYFTRRSIFQICPARPFLGSKVSYAGNLLIFGPFLLPYLGPPEKFSKKLWIFFLIFSGKKGGFGGKS